MTKKANTTDAIATDAQRSNMQAAALAAHKAIDKAVKATLDKDKLALAWRDMVAETYGNYKYATAPSGTVTNAHKPAFVAIKEDAFIAKHGADALAFANDPTIGSAAKMKTGKFRGKTKKYIQAQKNVPLKQLRDAVTVAEKNLEAGKKSGTRTKKQNVDTVANALQTIANLLKKDLKDLDNTTTAQQRNWLATVVKNAKKNQGFKLK